MEEQVKQGAPIATHKGVLAGLSEEERAQKIEAAIRHEYVEGQGDAKVSSLADQAQDGPVVTTLAEQLEAFTRDKLVEMAKDYDLKGYSKLKKPELAQAVAQACGEQDEDAVFTLIFASPAEFETARKATETGGILTLSDEEVSQGSFLEAMPPYVYVFRGEGEFTVLVPEELRQIDAIDYTLGQPSARALRNFFDAHVPDDDSDLYYADRLMESIADLNGNLVSFDETVHDLDEANLGLTAEERAEMLPLLRAMLEDLPYWENNGWSNNQVRASQGARAFYDENGEPLKVGRNDPCPCGSGKKYKKCCGK